MSNQNPGGGFPGLNSYSGRMGTNNLSNGYQLGYGYNGSGFEPINGYGFAFRKRMERIDWKKLASVDIDLISRNLDFQVLQDNITNIAFCNLDLELDPQSIDPNYTKLFKLAQFMIEYLLYSQEYLWLKLQEGQQELIKEKSEHDKTKVEDVDKVKVEISNLKKELHQRKKVINVQQQLLHSGSDAIHKCSFCPKAFVNASFLHAHISRRHVEMSVHHISSYQQIDTTKVPPSSSEVQQKSHEVENELVEIRERLQLTESELVDERNARNALVKKDHQEKEKLEKEINKKFESWKQEQLELQKSEIEKVQNMFMKELRDMSTKLHAAEENLEDLKHKRIPGSMLGSLKDDVDSEDLRKSKIKMAEDIRKEMLHQVTDVETRMRKEMMEHDKMWKKKMRELKLQDEEKIKQMNAEMDKIKQEENQRHLKDIEEKHRLTEEVIKQMKKFENDKKGIASEHSKQELPASKDKNANIPRADLSRSVVKSYMSQDTEEDEEEDEEEEEEEEEKNEDYHQMREVQAAHLRTLDSDENIQAVNIKKRHHDSDLLSACRNDSLQNLELALEALGIPKAATTLKSENYGRTIETLSKERSRKHKGKNDHFFNIRNRYAFDVNEQANAQLKHHKKVNKGTPKPKTPRSSRSTVRSQEKSVFLPQTQSKSSAPKPSPRVTGNSASKMISTGQSVLTTQTFTSTGTLSITGDSNTNSYIMEEVDQKRSSQPRPGVIESGLKTRTPSAIAATAVSRQQQPQAVENESDDETSNWDEISTNVEPLTKMKQVSEQTSGSRPLGNMVAQKTKQIEDLFMARDGKKPVGGIDVTTLKTQASLSTKKNTFQEEDIDGFSLTSVSDADEVKPTPKPRQTNARASFQSTSGPTFSTNTYETSNWGSSQNFGNSLENLELKDSWDDDNDDDDK